MREMLARLLALLFPPRDDERLVRNLAPDALLARLAPELVPLGDGFSASALLSYHEPSVRAAIHEAKYRGTSEAFMLLAAPLAEYLGELLADGIYKEAVLVAVPLGAKRRKERGYNQVEEVARRACSARGVEIPILVDTSLLMRTRETVSQVSLPRALRARNMRGAFRAAPELLQNYSRRTTYLLVDDVLTTGATLLAASQALKAAGAEHIAAIALAH